MKQAYLIVLIMLLMACKKGVNSSGCNIQQITAQNSAKVTINNGVWGTISIREGNCFPTDVKGESTCRVCPAKREVRLYDYATLNDLVRTPGADGINSIKTALIKTVAADGDGFYQADVPDGKYTIVFVENGILFPNSIGYGNGISWVEVKQNKANFNLMHNRAYD